MGHPIRDIIQACTELLRCIHMVATMLLTEVIQIILLMVITHHQVLTRLTATGNLEEMIGTRTREGEGDEQEKESKDLDMDEGKTLLQRNREFQILNRYQVILLLFQSNIC